MDHTENKPHAETPFRETVHPQPSAAHGPEFEPGFSFSIRAFIGAMQEAGYVPSWTRIIITTVVALAALCGAAYVASPIMAAFVAGAATLTASAFVLSAVSFIGALLVAVIAIWGVSKIFKWSFSGKVDRVLAGARNNVMWAITPDAKPPQRA
jgi:hypothetical protein